MTESPHPRRDSYDAVVVGAGIGGLTTAALLARAGMEVLVAEAHESPGGYVHAFERGDYTFDPAVHLLLDPPMWARLLEHLGVRDRVRFLEVDSFYTLSGPDFRMRTPLGKEAFIEAHVERFPRSADEIRQFFEACARVHHESHDLPARLPVGEAQEAMARFPTLLKYRTATLAEAADEYLSDDTVKAVCTVGWSYLGLPPSMLAFQTFAQNIFGHVIHGASYVEGGVQQLIDAFVASIEAHGGEVLLEARVTRIELEGDTVAGVRLPNGELVKAGTVISNADPLQTFGTLLPGADLPKPFTARLRRLKPSTSAFLLFAAAQFELPSHAAHYTLYTPTWDYEGNYRGMVGGSPERTGAGVAVPTLVDPTVAPPGHHQVIGLMFVDYANPWEDVKERYHQALLHELESVYPGIGESLVFAESATPLALERFTSNHHGAVYGWENTPNQTGSKRPDQETPIPGLYLVGGWTAPGGGFVRAAMSGMRAAELVLEREGSPATIPHFIS